MQKLIPVESAISAKKFGVDIADFMANGQIASDLAGFMAGDRYYIVKGWALVEAARLAHKRLIGIEELYTPVTPGLEWRVDEIREKYIHCGDNIYHPIMIRGFEKCEITRPTIERYNMVIGGLADQLPKFNGLGVVDIGCHHGYWSFSLQAAGFDVFGIDNVSTSLILATHLKALLDSRVKLGAADVRLGIFDAPVVLAMNVIHHLVKDMDVIEIEALLGRLAEMAKDVLVVSFREEDLGIYAEPGSWPGFNKDPIFLGSPRGSYPVWMLTK